MGRAGRAMRIDKDLIKLIESVSKEEDITLREASRELAKELKIKSRRVQF